MARVTNLGLFINLIEGVDLSRWCAEGLIDGIITTPLNWMRTVWDHDLRPCAALARKHAIPRLAEPKQTEALLADQQFTERRPVTRVDRSDGLDCHSWFNNFSIDGDSPI